MQVQSIYRHHYAERKEMCMKQQINKQSASTYLLIENYRVTYTRRFFSRRRKPLHLVT
jgi:hypothetical protein